MTWTLKNGENLLRIRRKKENILGGGNKENILGGEIWSKDGEAETSKTHSLIISLAGTDGGCGGENTRKQKEKGERNLCA